MPVYEVQVKAVQPDRGRLIALKIGGTVVPAGEYIDWVDSDIQPPSLTAISQRTWLISEWSRFRSKAAYFLDPGYDPQVAIRLRFPDFDTRNAEVQAKRLAGFEVLRQQVLAKDTEYRSIGFDTNWTRLEQQRYGIALLELTRSQAESWLQRHKDSRFPFPQMEKLTVFEFGLDPSTVPNALLQRWADPDDLVPLNRGMIPLTTANFERLPDSTLEP